MNFEDFATDLTEVRANLFALNIEIRELKQKIFIPLKHKGITTDERASPKCGWIFIPLE